MNNFQKRLKNLLLDRKITPWGRHLGLSSGTITALTDGRIPGSDILGLIARAERCSLNWLTTGNGRPFSAGRHITQHEFTSALQAHLEDSDDWQISIIIADAFPEHTVVIFQMPGSIDYKGKTVDYTIMEIECGRWSQNAAALFGSSTQCTSYHINDSNPEASSEFGLIVAGFAGTYRIKKLLNSIKPVDNIDVIGRPTVERIDNTNNKNDGASAEIIDLELMRSIITAVNAAAAEELREVTPDQFARAVTSLYRRTNPGSEISDQMVMIALDSAQPTDAKKQNNETNQQVD